VIAALLVLLAAAAVAQQDQTPRPAVKDTRGLLNINRDFYEMAAATGGDFYFWSAGEFATSNLQIPIEHDEVVLSYGSLETKRVFEIPVESGARSLTVFAGVQRKDLALLVRPDGNVTHERDRDASVQSFQHMIIATIQAPVAGMWRLELHGAGMFCVTAHVQPGADGPGMTGFDFVELRRALRRSESLPCELVFSGTVRDLQVEFVAKDGATIGRALFQSAGDDRYAGKCVVPKEPFRVSVSGSDANGKPFRRIERGLRVPQ